MTEKYLRYGSEQNRPGALPHGVNLHFENACVCTYVCVWYTVVMDTGSAIL